MTVLNPFSQKIFTVKEIVPGTLAFPTPATDSIIGAGYVNASRGVSYTDSPEIRNSLNIRDQVKDKDTAGEWSFPILVRPSGVTTDTPKSINKPMGSVLYDCAIGRDMSGDTGALKGTITGTPASFTVDGLEDRPKAPCVVLIGSELIYIKHIGSVVADIADDVKFQAVFYIGERGYAGTTAADHADDSVITIKSHTYSQETNRGSFSLWFQRDTITYFCRGCTVSGISYTGENKGYPTFEFNGGFMTMGWAGRATLSGVHTAGSTELTLGSGESKYFSIGARIYNVNLNDYENTNNYVITDIDHDSNTITVNTGISQGWGNGNTISGYLPEVVSIGSTLKSEDTMIEMGDYSSTDAPSLTAKKPTGLSVTFDSPIKYIEEEITPDAISEYTEEKRSISGSLTQLMTIEELSKFYISDYDIKQSISIRLGEDTDGYKCMIYMPRCTIQVPKENVSEPIVEQSMDYTAVDSDVEDSFTLAFV